MSVDTGTAAPDFTLPTDGGGAITLSSLRGKPVVVYFYPKDDTTGCTKQACGFRDSFPDFSGLGVTIIGISKDGVKSHDRFKAKYELPFILAADTETTVADAYGVWVKKSMYGREYMGMERTTFLIDTEGQVAKVWRKVKVAGHVEAVMEAVTALG